jgi:hypothetical protein
MIFETDSLGHSGSSEVRLEDIRNRASVADARSWAPIEVRRLEEFLRASFVSGTGSSDGINSL